MATVSNEVFLLVFTYIIVYALVYRENKMFGNLVFTGLGAVTFLFSDVSRAISWILTILPLINMAGQFMFENVKPKH